VTISEALLIKASAFTASSSYKNAKPDYYSRHNASKTRAAKQL
jgi:hypothetical protein